jgi:hypothetical protein
MNKVPIGIPMPPAYCEIIKYAIGTQTVSEFTLFGTGLRSGGRKPDGVVQKTVAPGSSFWMPLSLGPLT